MKKVFMAAGVMAALSTSALASAPLTIVSTTSRTETVVFAGIQWNFGSSTPELVLGARTTRSTDTHSVFGGKIDIAIPLDEKAWRMPTLRILGLGGSCDVQGEAGVGYSFATSSPLFALGVQAPYANAGLNYSIGGKLSPYIGLNSLRKPACAFKAGQNTPG